MACTAFPKPALGLFINNVQGVWSDVNQNAGGKSATYTSGTLVVTGPSGSTGPISPGANQKVRHKFFGTGNFLAVCVSDTGAGPKSHRLSIVNFNATPPAVVLQFTTPIDNNPPLPFVQFDTGPGSACCVGGASGTQIFGLAILRSDTGEVLTSVGGGFTPSQQVIGEAVAAGVQIKHGGTIIAGPAAVPSGELDVQPNSQTFTDVKLGGCPQPASTKSFTLKNVGNDCLDITAIANVAPYTVTNVSPALPQSLKKNESVNVTVTFAPASTGSFNNVALAVTRSPAKGESEIKCSGKAVTAQPAFSVTPNAIDFGHVLLGTTTPAKLITIKNSGDVPISISVAGSPPGSVYQWAGLNINLTCGQQQTLAVSFTPAVDGPAPNQTVTVISTPGGNKTVMLSGEGCVPNAKIAVPPAPFPGFGQVRQGYRMPRFITVNNTGDDVLNFTATISGPNAALFGLMKPSHSVTDVASTLPFSVAPVEHCGGGVTGDGVEEVAVVFFANAAPATVANATLTLSNHNDASAAASFSYALTGEVIAGNVVDVVSVFDSSGSMGDAVPGGGNKMGAAIQAGRLLVKLIPPDVNNRVAATRFATTASTFAPIAVVSAGSQTAQTDAIKDPPLTPNGATAIAAGAMTGIKEFATAHPAGPQPNLTKAMVVLTDGMDNTAFKNPDDGKFYSLGVVARDPANLSVFIPTEKFVPPPGVKVYAVGLGTQQDIDMTQLAALSSGAGGYYGAVDPTQPALEYQLMKYYTQIYMDLVDTSVLKDPRDTIYPGQKHEIEFDVLTGDVCATVVMYDLHALRLPFWLESPQGEIVDAGFVPPGFQMRAGFTETTRFLDVVLPWADPKRYAGRWKLIVVHAGRVCRGKPSTKEHKEVGFTPRDCAESKQPVDYGYMIGVGSNFRLQAFLNGGPVHVGEPIRMTGMPTEAGLPVPGCKVTVDVVSPNGQKWLDIKLFDDGAHDDGGANDGEYARSFAHTAVAGAYNFTFRATGFTRDGEAVHREVMRAKIVEARVVDDPGRPGHDGGGNTPPGGEDCCKKLVARLDRQTKILEKILDKVGRAD